MGEEVVFRKTVIQREPWINPKSGFEFIKIYCILLGMIPRHLTAEIQVAYREFKAIAVTGPRQSGKTTLLRHIFCDLPYANLETPKTQEFAATDPERFLTQFPEGAILDEIQRVPQLFSWLQGILDEGKAKFVLSGSNNFLLSESISQSLAGRVAILTLLPFAQAEIANEISLEERLFLGMYPSVVAERIHAGRWYGSYIQTYVERDVRLLKNIGDIDTFRRFMQLLAGRTAQVLNLQSLAGDTGISQPTAKSWLGLLQASFLVFTLRPHTRSFRKQIVKSPKVYFWDTGIVCSLLGIQSADELVSHSARGALFETYCVSEFHKYYANQGETAPLYWWRDKRGHEVDLVVARNPQRMDKLIEFKSGLRVASDAADNLRYLAGLCPDPKPECTVVYGGQEFVQRTAFAQLGWRDMFAGPHRFGLRTH